MIQFKKISNQLLLLYLILHQFISENWSARHEAWEKKKKKIEIENAAIMEKKKKIIGQSYFSKFSTNVSSSGRRQLPYTDENMVPAATCMASWFWFSPKTRHFATSLGLSRKLDNRSPYRDSWKKKER